MQPRYHDDGDLETQTLNSALLEASGDRGIRAKAETTRGVGTDTTTLRVGMEYWRKLDDKGTNCD
jgi:putative aminopeptidase FrvX